MKATGLEWSTAAATMPGETVSGDRHWAGPVANGMIFAVIDGLGHGRAAAAASKIAVAMLQQYAGDPLIELLHRCHESLRATRGVAMSLARFNTEDSVLTWTLGHRRIARCVCLGHVHLDGFLLDVARRARGQGR